MFRQILSLAPRASATAASRHGSTRINGMPHLNIYEDAVPKIVEAEHVPPVYREMTQPSNRAKYFATFLSAVTWTWILYSCYSEPEMVTGHYPWPDASKWTNKELGIPDDIPLDEEAA